MGPGSDLLDVGCGAGRFCRIAADRAGAGGLRTTGGGVRIEDEYRYLVAIG